MFYMTIFINEYRRFYERNNLQFRPDILWLMEAKTTFNCWSFERLWTFCILYLIYASFLYCFLFVVYVSVCITVFCVWLYLSQCLCAHTTVTTASKTHVSSLFRALPLFPSLSLALKQLSF